MSRGLFASLHTHTHRLIVSTGLLLMNNFTWWPRTTKRELLEIIGAGFNRIDTIVFIGLMP